MVVCCIISVRPQRLLGHQVVCGQRTTAIDVLFSTITLTGCRPSGCLSNAGLNVTSHTDVKSLPTELTIKGEKVTLTALCESIQI